jgi:hypothetical protein
MNLHFLKSVSVLLIVAFTLSSCASIVGSTSYPVNIRTDPKGSTLSITDKKGKEIYKGESPATVILKSGAGFFARAEYQVKISSPGYSEKIVPITFRLNGWYWGNILIGGLIGMLIVDPATGAMWKITDPIVNETLVKTTVSTSTNTSLNILDVNNVSEKFKAKLIRIN